MALTATATESVRNDIIDALRLREPRVTITGYDRFYKSTIQISYSNLNTSHCCRKNLYIHASRRTTSVNQHRAYELDLLPLLEEEDGHGRRNFGGPSILYCQTREDVEKLAVFLRGAGVHCAGYHAGMPDSARREAHRQFTHDEVSTVVATIAFGMGIDKKDVRNVIH